MWQVVASLERLPRPLKQSTDRPRAANSPDHWRTTALLRPMAGHATGFLLFFQIQPSVDLNTGRSTRWTKRTAYASRTARRGSEHSPPFGPPRQPHTVPTDPTHPRPAPGHFSTGERLDPAANARTDCPARISLTVNVYGSRISFLSPTALRSSEEP